MDLISCVLGLAYRRPRVLLVEAPTGRELRLRAQDELAARGWALADGPASTDLLVVCGEPGPALLERLDVLWEQLAGPRARTRVRSADALSDALDDSRGQLCDVRRQRDDAARRGRGGPHGAPAAEPENAATDGGVREHGGTEQPGTEQSGTKHGGMDHGGTDDGGMELPGGLTMSGSGEDRDGLQLEQSQAELGPVLPGWPAGLVARVTLQGDVAVEVELQLLDDVPGDLLAAAVGRLDRGYAVLSLAGSRHAAAARRERAAALDGVSAGTAALARTVAGDRVLRWSLRNLTTVTGTDLWVELLALLDGSASSDPVSLTDAGEALTGRELAALRLALAAAPAVVPDRQPARA